MHLKQKARIKIRQISVDIFPNQTMQELTDCLFQFIQTKKNALKRPSAFSYYLPKGTINNYNFIIDEKKNYDQPIDSDVKQYKELRKLRTC